MVFNDRKIPIDIGKLKIVCSQGVIARNEAITRQRAMVGHKRDVIASFLAMTATTEFMVLVGCQIDLELLNIEV